MWQVTEQDLESIAIGAGILGTGGGGSPYTGMLRSRLAIRENGPINVLSPDELTNDDQVICVGAIGAPTVGIEKMIDKQAYYAFRAIEEYTGTRATALVSNEIGGSNSLEPIIPAAMSGLSVVDADGMGRAYPEFQMKTFFVYGVPYVPMAIADEKGNSAIIPEAISAKWVERMARALTIQMGCVACYAIAPMTAEQIRTTAVLGSLTLTKKLGDAVKRARRQHEDPIDAILETHPGKVLFQGKITDLERRTTQGFARGNLTIEGMGQYNGDRMRIEFQNENLIALIDGEVVCIVPDLICVVDTERGEPITTELLRYGFRVTVLGFPGPHLWTAPPGLAVAGPKAFGYDVEFTPLALDPSRVPSS